MPSLASQDLNSIEELALGLASLKKLTRLEMWSRILAALETFGVGSRPPVALSTILLLVLVSPRFSHCSKLKDIGTLPEILTGLRVGAQGLRGRMDFGETRWGTGRNPRLWTTSF